MSETCSEWDWAVWRLRVKAGKEVYKAFGRLVMLMIPNRELQFRARSEAHKEQLEEG